MSREQQPVTHETVDETVIRQIEARIGQLEYLVRNLAVSIGRQAKGEESRIRGVSKAASIRHPLP